MRQAVKPSLKISAATGRPIIRTGWKACATGGFEHCAHISALKGNFAAGFSVN
jgi:hypothetical protein